MDTSTVGEALPVSIGAAGRRTPRRYRPIEEKIRIVEEAEQSGASVAEVARRHGVNANLLFSWRRQHRDGLLGKHTRAPAKLLPVQVAASRCQELTVPSQGVIEIDLPGEVRLRVRGDVTAEQLVAVLCAVVQRR